ncbi:MAG: endonuclease III [Syntrophobacterales bacterium]|nr:endonuclease III [Syntrophobacterales bacterium]
MNDEDIAPVIRILKGQLRKWDTPVVTQMAEEERSPFAILIATILSSRTKDETTAAAAERLFRLASTPGAMSRLTEEEVAKAIYPVGFYRTKAKNVVQTCKKLVESFSSAVPDNLEDLMTLPGVGRKTANLVLSLGFGGPGLCVDTHVHRISNRLGYVKTKTPGETERKLREKLPRRYWSIYNTVMVAHGQNICRPVSPFCSKCPVSRYCDRVGVARNR